MDDEDGGGEVLERFAPSRYLEQLATVLELCGALFAALQADAEHGHAIDSETVSSSSTSPVWNKRHPPQSPVWNKNKTPHSPGRNIHPTDDAARFISAP